MKAESMHPGIRWSGIERRIGSNGLSGERKGYVVSQPRQEVRALQKEGEKKSVKNFFKVRAAQWQLITYAGTSASRGNWAIKVGSGAEKVRETGKNFRMSTAFNPFTRRKVRRKSV